MLFEYVVMNRKGRGNVKIVNCNFHRKGEKIENGSMNVRGT